jgi:4-hydroxybenzoate polyprenyltransferase
MNQWIKYLDYFFVNRPILFFPGWATLLAGYLAATHNIKLFHLITTDNFYFEFWNPIIFQGLLAFSFAMGSSFILNQICDISSDKKNRKLFLMGEGHISVNHGYIESFILITLSLILSIKIGLSLLLLMSFFIMITGYFYNYPPFNFKDKPISGLIANMIMGWLAFAIGWTLLVPFNGSLVNHSIPYLFFNTSLYFLTTLPDVEGDTSSKKITFPVKYGFTSTIWISVLFFLLSIVSSIIIGDQFLLLVLILNILFVLNLIRKKNVSTALLVIKTGIFFFCIILSVKFPLFFLAITLLFFFTRFYYKRRFQFDYPSFK